MSEINNEIDSQLNEQKPMSRKMAFLMVAVISLLAGMAGGVYGAVNLANRPEVRKFFGQPMVSDSGQAINQNVVLDEE